MTDKLLKVSCVASVNTTVYVSVHSIFDFGLSEGRNFLPPHREMEWWPIGAVYGREKDYFDLV